VPVVLAESALCLGGEVPVAPYHMSGTPEFAELVGTLRSTSEKARETALAGIDRVATHVAAAHLCEVEITKRRGYPVTVNHGGFAGFASRVATDLLGKEGFVEREHPLMGAEDFSYVLQKMPGCMFFLGVRPDGHDPRKPVHSCHSNHMILNEDSMAVGIAMHAAVAQRYLERGLSE
jgi:hippurate hydrolase